MPRTGKPRRPQTTARRGQLPRVVLATAVALGLIAVTGCTTEDPNGPERTVQRLAKALASGDPSGIRFTDTPTKRVARWLRTATDEMEPARLRVRPGEIERGEDDTATAKLRYEWRIDQERWTYQSTARLTRVEDEWQVRFAPTLLEPSLRKGETLDLVRLSPERGDIVGADEEPIVTERPVLRFGIDKTRVDPDQQEDSARSLAELLDIDADSFADEVSAAGDQAFVEAIVLRTGDVTPAIDLGYREIEGASALPDEVPLAPTREFARPILGTVGAVTAEIIEQNPEVYEVGDQAGLSGLQQRYEDRLRGTPGFAVRAIGGESDDSDSGDSGERELFRTDAGNGKNLNVTLRTDLQLAAEQILADQVGDASASALVAIRPSDGHVLAAADGPGTEGFSVSTVGQYPPGSTFKVASTLALLRSGATPSTTLPCPTNTTVDGKNFENYDDYPPEANGDITLRTAFAYSCNTSFILGRADATPAALSEAAASLGLGVDHDLGYPVYLGSVPDSASGTGAAAATIGQGELLASPVSMAAVAASVAKGETVVPQLVTESRPTAGQQGASDASDDQSGGGAEVKPLTSDEADQLRTLMRAVVTEGSGSFLADVPGEEVIAKTGTAEFERDGELLTHAWMIAAQGDLAVAAFVELGDSGSSTAGPLVEEFLRTAATE